jgi:hypothetical protein
MIFWFCRLWNTYRAHVATEQYQRGYEWAAAELLSGRMTPFAVEHQTGISLRFDGKWHPFDGGARKALNDFIRLPERMGWRTL